MRIHGGDIYRNHIKYDFSVNVNPLGVPETVKKALHKSVENCEKYPDIDCERLKRAVGEFLHVPEAYLLFGNGASELFMAVVHAIRPKRTVIPVPSFYGYEYAARAAGSELLFYERKQEKDFCLDRGFYDVLKEEADLLFLANPNNPDGGLLDQETLTGLLRHCQDKEITVVLDECFIEFCENASSMISAIEVFDNLILVRSFTKIFAIPGVRLGYLVCGNRGLLQKIAGQLPEWNLSCFAQEAGVACVGQGAFIRETADYVKKERQFLQEGLRQRGYRVFPGEANFILFYCEAPLYQRLLEAGILVRDCSNFRGLGMGFYRVAVRSHEENKILLDVLGRG